MNNYMIGALMFIVGMLFMHSLTGEYSRYGMGIDDEVKYCEEIEQKECDYIIAPVTSVPLPSSSSSPFYDRKIYRLQIGQGQYLKNKVLA